MSKWGAIFIRLWSSIATTTASHPPHPEWWVQKCHNVETEVTWDSCYICFRLFLNSRGDGHSVGGAACSELAEMSRSRANGKAIRLYRWDLSFKPAGACNA